MVCNLEIHRTRYIGLNKSIIIIVTCDGACRVPVGRLTRVVIVIWEIDNECIIHFSQKLTLIYHPTDVITISYYSNLTDRVEDSNKGQDDFWVVLL